MLLFLLAATSDSLGVDDKGEALLLLSAASVQFFELDDNLSRQSVDKPVLHKQQQIEILQLVLQVYLERVAHQ